MRLLRRIEQAFIAKTVEETRRLLESDTPTHQKIAALQFAAAEEDRRIELLKARLGHHPQARSRIQEIIAMRREAMLHYRFAARRLREGSKRLRFDEQPRVFAFPHWEDPAKAREEPPGRAAVRSEFPFMEFSS